MTLWLNWPGSRPMAGVHLSRRGEEPGEHVGQATGIEGKVLSQSAPEADPHPAGGSRAGAETRGKSPSRGSPVGEGLRIGSGG